jgi:Domain of unknown function (DUF1906)
MAVIVGGFTFGVIGSRLGHQAVIGASVTTDVRPAIKDASLTADIKSQKKTVSKTGRKAAFKTIEYDGVEFSVPAGWPVYWLNQHPDQCVRYDKNAVYVGTPGPDQNCPAGLIGRADTISIGGPFTSAAPANAKGQKAPVKAPVKAQKTKAPNKAPARDDQRASLEGKPISSTSAAAGTIMQNSDLREFAVAMPASSPWINATYGTDPGLVKQTLSTVREIDPQSAAMGRVTGKGKVTQVKGPDAKSASNARAVNPAWPKNPPPPTGAAAYWSWPTGVADETATSNTATSSTGTATSSLSNNPTGIPTTTATPAPQVTPAPVPTPSPSPSAVLADNPTKPSTGPNGAMPGFDTCTAPSLATMKAWRAKYAATAIYIGGQMMGCDYGNLSASWIQQAEKLNWSLLPTYVGLQAPCNSFSGKINATQAASQGTTAADQAVVDAKTFGLGAGTPIYYDMEAYDRTNASCHTAVLTFLSAWDKQLTALGYVSGVYSSADAAIKDLQTTTTIAGQPLVEPKAIWFALWDNASNLTGSPYMTSSTWPVSDRSKQFAGNVVVKVGGISMEIDSDWVNSPAVRG